MIRNSPILIAVFSASAFAFAGTGCAGQLDDESRFVDAGTSRGGSSGAGTGGSTASGGSSGSGTGGSGPDSGGTACDYMKLLTTSCGLNGCHAAATASAGINLGDPTTVASLVGKPAPSGGCASVSSVLVVNKATPTDSLLYVVTGATQPSGYCGLKMPLGSPTGLPAADRDCLLSWIQTLAAAN